MAGLRCAHAMDDIVRESRPEWASWMTRKALFTKPVHRWFTFPHSFTSELVDALIDEWSLSTGDLVLDPFVGAGTTVLTAKQRRIPARGYDISPLAQLVSGVKVADYQLSRLQTLSKRLARKLPHRYASGANFGRPCDFLAKALPGELLHAFLGVAKTIDGLACDATERDFFKLALMAIVPVFSRAQATGGWLKWVDNQERVGSLRSVFDDQVRRMLNDIDEDSSLTGKCWHVGLADARSLPDDTNTYTALITSPPYPNRHDYTRVFGVELMLGFLTETQTQRLRHDSLQSHPEARPYKDDMAGYRHPATLNTILGRLSREGVDSRVCRMLDGYFKDIYRCLREARRVCRRGARLAFVVGNVQYGGHSIPVDELTAELGARAGLRCKRMCVARYRGNSAQQMRKHGRRPSRETIVLFERH